MKPEAVLLVSLLGAVAANAVDPRRLDEVLSGGFSYRNVGPFRAGSWIADLAVPEKPARSHLYTFYAAARNGGVWKTTNNGTTFEPLFDDQSLLSIGALAVAPSDENTIWVGTGDASCTRSAYHGDGIYKSTDAGRTWQHLGLADSHHIARIVVDPANPDVVYVAAMGHLFSTNPERGVFKSIDGGKSWKKILYLNERTGAIDLVQDRHHPNTLYAAMYECVRHAWLLEDGGPGSGIYKTTDDGATWKRLEGGLPTGVIGRIGLDLYRNNPDVLYAIIDNRNRNTAAEESETGRGRGSGRGPRLIGGEVYRTDDAGRTWRKMNSARDDLSRKSGYAFNQIRIDPGNPDHIFVTGETLASSSDGGRTWTALTESRASRPFRKAFGDFRTLWIDPENPERMIAGSDGGVFLSYDGGKSCDHLANLPLGEIYALTVDLESPYNIYAGLQDHESWKGPSDGWSGSVGEEDWTTVGTGDGMYNQVDPTDSRWVYNTQEFGRHARYDQKSRERKTIAPTRPPGQPRLRFNWVAPLLLSPHDSKTLYAGAQVLFRSRDRGDHWQEISPDLTGNDTNKISPPGTSIQFCTITTIAESVARAGILWVGTDDGKVQVTKDDGMNWTEVTKAIALAGGPEDAWVTRVAASPSAPGTAYVAKSRHRQDDFRPFVIKTTDFGATWIAITNQLPVRPVNVIAEDSANTNLLFLGNDTGVYVSLDGGARWSPLKGNMPPVPVNALMIHPREADLVAGTFGRGIWITDIAPLREMNEAMWAQDVHFFNVQPRAWRRQGALGNYHLYGDRHVVTPNDVNGLIFDYYLKQATAEKVTITIADATGATVRTQPGTAKAGLNRVGLTARLPGQFDGPADSNRQPLPPGEYVATLTVGERSYTQKVRIPASSALEENSGTENPDEDKP